MNLKNQSQIAKKTSNLSDNVENMQKRTRPR